jgi:hypothetical protein
MEKYLLKCNKIQRPPYWLECGIYILTNVKNTIKELEEENIKRERAKKPLKTFAFSIVRVDWLYTIDFPISLATIKDLSMWSNVAEMIEEEIKDKKYSFEFVTNPFEYDFKIKISL